MYRDEFDFNALERSEGWKEINETEFLARLSESSLRNTYDLYTCRPIHENVHMHALMHMPVHSYTLVQVHTHAHTNKCVFKERIFPCVRVTVLLSAYNLTFSCFVKINFTEKT